MYKMNRLMRTMRIKQKHPVLSSTVSMFDCAYVLFHARYRLVGLVVRRPPRERKIPASNPACDGIFSGSSHTSDLKNGTPVATLPGAWRYRVSAGTGRPDASILWLGEMESWICNFYLSVAARNIVWADPSLRYTRMLLGRQATNKQTMLSHTVFLHW